MAYNLNSLFFYFLDKIYLIQVNNLIIRISEARFANAN